MLSWIVNSTLHPARSPRVACPTPSRAAHSLCEPPQFSACRGGSPLRYTFIGVVHSQLFLPIFNPRTFSYLQIPLSATPLFSHPSVTTRGGIHDGLPKPNVISRFPVSFFFSRACALFVTAFGFPSFIFKRLRTLFANTGVPPVLQLQTTPNRLICQGACSPLVTRHSPLATSASAPAARKITLE